jgi:hypothetical protein
MHNTRRVLVVVALGLAALAGCSQQQTASDDVSRVVEQIVALTPATIPVKIGPLVLRNASEDQAVRLIGAEVTYLGEGGAAIKLDTSRHDSAFTFPSYSVERLDPGDEMRHSLDVPFPAAAFDGGLAELRLGVDYLPMPYRVGTVTVEVSAGVRS